MQGMVQAGGSPNPSSNFNAVCGVFLALIGVLGVVLAEADADAGFFRGVCGSRGVVESGKALAR